MNEIYLNILKIKRTIQPSLNIRMVEYLPTKTVQRKRHKRKSSRRWQKKWLKRFGSMQVETDDIYQIGDTLFMSRSMERRIKERIKNDLLNFERQQAEMIWRGEMFD